MSRRHQSTCTDHFGWAISNHVGACRDVWNEAGKGGGTIWRRPWNARVSNSYLIGSMTRAAEGSNNSTDGAVCEEALSGVVGWDGLSRENIRRIFESVWGMEARTREIRNERRDSGHEVDAVCLSDCLGAEGWEGNWSGRDGWCRGLELEELRKW